MRVRRYASDSIEKTPTFEDFFCANMDQYSLREKRNFVDSPENDLGFFSILKKEKSKQL